MATGRVPTTANSPLTAKGDLFGYSTTQARVAVGANGETLVADSSTSTGLRYQAPVNVNPILNSSFQVWQRGTSMAITTTGSGYTADRWLGYRSVAGSTISRQVTNDTTNLPFIQYCARVQRDSGNTSTAAITIYNPFESINSIPYAGKTVTFSYYARAGANYSPTSSGLGVSLVTGTGTDQNPFSYTGSAIPISATSTLTTTWQRFTHTATLAATATELYAAFSSTPTGTAGANDWFEVTGVQLEVGSVATPFKTYAGTIQGELAACQRYFQRLDSSNDASVDFSNGTVLTSSLFRGVIHLRTTMRTAPSTAFSAANLFQITSSTNITAASIILSTAAPNQVCLACDLLSGGTAGFAGILRANSSTAAFINLSAEL
jgi:hypothetical protein